MKRKPEDICLGLVEIRLTASKEYTNQLLRELRNLVNHEEPMPPGHFEQLAASLTVEQEKMKMLSDLALDMLTALRENP